MTETKDTNITDKTTAPYKENKTKIKNTKEDKVKTKSTKERKVNIEDTTITEDTTKEDTTVTEKTAAEDTNVTDDTTIGDTTAENYDVSRKADRVSLFSYRQIASGISL